MKVLDVETKEIVFVSTVVRKVTLVKAKFAQPEFASTASVVNMVVVLAVAKGKGT